MVPPVRGKERPMRRGAKPGKAKVEPKRPVARKSLKSEHSRVRDLEKRLEEALHREVEALDRQTATAEILHVISQSPTDVQPVFDTIVRNAVRLCGALHGGVYRFDGELVHSVAHDGYTPGQLEQWRATWPRPVTATSMACQAIRTRHVVRIPDLEAAPELVGLGPETLANLRARGTRSVMAVPMYRQNEVIGAISLAHREVDAFSATQVDLLTTFADQAVIAIENVRLSNETKEALEKQTATSQILRVISLSPTDVQPVFDTIVRSAGRLCNGTTAAVFLVRDGTLYHPANYGGAPEALAAARARYPRPLGLDTGPGIAILTRSVHEVRDVEDSSTAEHIRAVGRVLGFRSVITVPMLREGEAIGAIAVTRREPGPFSEGDMALLQTFADQAVIAIDNVRLFRELEARNRDLTNALEQQTATSDVLRIIAQSPTELQPVLDAIATSAVRLCAASDAVIERLEGDRFYNAAHAGAQMKGLVGLPLPLTRRFPGGRAVLDRKPIIIDDIMLIAESEYPDTLELLKLNAVHSCAEIPLLSEGKALGNLAVLRAEVRPFTDAEVALLQTFADQAVIAIENVRLFKELQEKNRALTEAHGQVTEALEQKTATAEILRVISSAPMDVQPVF